MHNTAALIDVETTGFSPHYDEVIEFAICLFRFDRETGEILGVVEDYVGLREPRKKIPYSATRVHGIKNEDVRGMDLDYDKLKGLLNQADFFIAHNASFDRGFTQKMFPLLTEKPWVCSMRGINWRQKGFNSRGLQNLLQAHGITVKRSHRALDDVMATLSLLSQKCVFNKKPYLAELIDCLSGQFQEQSGT